MGNSSLEKWRESRMTSPIREFSYLQDAFDRLLGDAFNHRAKSGRGEMEFTPSCEVTEDVSAFHFKFDLPGVKKENVKLEIDKDMLTVRAERKDERKEGDHKKHYSEVYYGTYMRSFTLPSSIDEKRVEAKYDNGVLTINVPKIETQKVKQVPIG